MDSERLRGIIIYSLGHLFFLSVVFVFFRLQAGETILPTPHELNKWDASWYNSIVASGYRFQQDLKSNVAFFPLFPYVWKALHLNGLGISLFNVLVFYLGFGILAYHYRIAPRYYLLYLSVPVFMFMYVPYTEAMFFLFSGLLLLGLRNGNTGLICFSLLICSFIRPVATVFLPALIIMEILTQKRTHLTFRNLAFYCGCVLLGLAGVMLIQYVQTGTAFGFFYAQKAWQHYFRLPDLPFTSSFFALSKILDGTALLLGCLAGAKLFTWFRQWLENKNNIPDKALVFSALYLFGMTMAIVFFQGGSLHSLNRYFFATAFFIVFLHQFLTTYRLKTKNLKWIILGLLIFWLPVGSYQKFMAFINYTLLTIYLIAYLYLESTNKKVSGGVMWLLYFVNVFFQVYLLQMFFHSQWVG